jgi:hypothetical protein
VLVVGFDDFDVIAALLQGLGRHFQQLEGHVHAHAHIGEKTMEVFWANSAICAFAHREAVVPMTTPTPQIGRHGQVLHRAFGAGEVDQAVGLRQGCAHIAFDLQPLGLPRNAEGSVPMQGLSARSSAAASTQSLLFRIASISIWPMRPEAPATATR